VKKPYGPDNRYVLTEEHRAQLPEWRDKWIAIALRTEPQTEDDRKKVRTAMRGMYRAAKLTPPKHEVFASSPISAAIAAGVASGVWWCRDNPKEAEKLFGPVDESRLMSALRVACALAVRAGMGERVSVPAATNAATYAATYAATNAATRDATYAATRAATDAATRDATDAATRDATNDPLATFFLRCVGMSYRMRNGGNQWAGWCSYLSFFARVAKLGLPQFRAWRHYESAAIHGGPRYVHKRFWIVSDFPQTIGRDEQNRPHCLTGPQLSWRDGWKTYYVHGVRVPAWVVENPERITVASIEAEQNAEIRRVMVERYGIQRYVRDAQFDVLDTDKDPLGQPRRLLRRGDVVVVELTNSTVDADGTRRVYHVPCEPELRPMPRMPGGEWGAPQTLTALNAVASTYSMRGEDYRLAVET